MQQRVNIEIKVDSDKVIITQAIKTLTIINTISFEELYRSPQIWLAIFPRQNIVDKAIRIDFETIRELSGEEKCFNFYFSGIQYPKRFSKVLEFDTVIRHNSWLKNGRANTIETLQLNDYYGKILKEEKFEQNKNKLKEAGQFQH